MCQLQIFSFFIFLIFNILVNLCPLQPQIPDLSWWEWNPIWSFTIVVHLAQGSTCFLIWDTFLLTTVLESGYLSYHSLTVNLAIVLWLLLSTKLTGWHSLCVFLFFVPLCVNYRLADWIIVWISGCTGVPNKVASECKY